MRLLAFLEVGSVEYILLLAVFLVLVGIMYTLGKRRRAEQSRADELQKQYETLTRAMLEELPDDRLAEAVVANLMAKTDAKNPDPYYVVMALSRGRRAIYSVWLTTHELTEGTLKQYQSTPSVRFGETAVDGFALIGAEGCAQALQTMLEGPEDEEMAQQAFRDAVAADQPLALAAAYIRENPDEFTDEPLAEPPLDNDQAGEPVTEPDSTGQ